MVKSANISLSKTHELNTLRRRVVSSVLSVFCPSGDAKMNCCACERAQAKGENFENFKSLCKDWKVMLKQFRCHNLWWNCMFTYSKDSTWNVLKFLKIHFPFAEQKVFKCFFKDIGYITETEYWQSSHLSDLWNFALSLDP